MGKFFFEEDEVEFYEDKVVKSENYSIQGNNLVAKKELELVTTTTIHNYGDGIMLYLKFDESGNQTIVYPTLAIVGADAERSLASIVFSADINIKRYGNNFHIKVKDDVNQCGNYIFVSITESKDIKTIDIAFTKLQEVAFIQNQYVALSFYEQFNDKHAWSVVVYDLSGRIVKTFVDETEDPNIVYRIKVDANENSGTLIVGKLQGTTLINAMKNPFVFDENKKIEFK